MKDAVPIREQSFSVYLDALRGLAALAVLFSHARVLFMASMTEVEQFSLVTKALYFLSGYGHLAVMIFFVLSGYLIGGTVIRNVRENRWSWNKYLLQRLTRLYIVFLPSLALTLLWDQGEHAISSEKLANSDTAIAIIKSSTIQENTSTQIFFGNAAFLQTIVVPSLGSNTPLWSLANEFWYYLLFPLIWISFFGRQFRINTRLIFLIISAIIFILVGIQISLYFLIWLLGCIVAILPEISFLGNLNVRNLTCVSLTLIFILALVIIRINRNIGEDLSNLIIAIVFSFLLFCLKHCSEKFSASLLRKTSKFFADFSYTLYLVHLPPLIFLRSIFTYETAWQPTPVKWLYLFTILIAVIFYAYLLSLFTERKTDHVRFFLEISLFKNRFVNRKNFVA